MPRKEKVNYACRLKGIAASPGIASGPAVIVSIDLASLEKTDPGSILVARHSSPNLVVVIARVSGIVTDFGGKTSHLATIARELSIPCVVGTQKATSTIQSGKWITVNGYTGEVLW